MGIGSPVQLDSEQVKQMMDKSKLRNLADIRQTPYELFMLVLCVYVLMELGVETFFQLPNTTREILDYLDNAVCCVFIVDFFVNLVRAESKVDFLKWGWIDLASSIPMINSFRIGRTFRLIRILRLLRGFYSSKRLITHLLKHRAETGFLAAALVCVVLVIFSSIGILQLETDPQSNIKTPEDALWWAFVTVTTVGYGDKFPITTEGRILAAGLMTAGVGLFGTFTGFVASWFLTQDEHAKEEAQENELEKMRAELSAMRQLLEHKLH